MTHLEAFGFHVILSHVFFVTLEQKQTVGDCNIQQCFLLPDAGVPTHHYVPSPHKLEPRLEDGDVQDVNEVTQVVGQQPVVNVVWSLVGEGPADWDEPRVPVPRQGDQQHPQHVHQIWGKRPT